MYKHNEWLRFHSVVFKPSVCLLFLREYHSIVQHTADGNSLALAYCSQLGTTVWLKPKFTMTLGGIYSGRNHSLVAPAGSPQRVSRLCRNRTLGSCAVDQTGTGAHSPHEKESFPAEVGGHINHTGLLWTIVSEGGVALAQAGTHLDAAQLVTSAWREMCWS